MEEGKDYPKFKTVEEELTFLREKISRREQELRDQKKEFPADQVVKEEIEKYKNVLDKEVLDETLALSKSDAESIVLNLEPEQHDQKVEELLTVMSTKGIKNAISLLSSLNNPHLEDDFHRFLVQYLKHGYEAKGVNLSDDEWRGLNMTLYEVVLPEASEDGEDKGKSLKELISGMEQFLSGMLSVIAKDGTKDYSKNYIVLEIANALKSDQFIFHVAVPNQHKMLFEKQVLSIFHDALLLEKTSDYNVFNSEGISVGSIIEPKENPAFEIKTYDKFDFDPMNVILNSFSKIKKDGEGAGIQIIFAPKGDYYQKNYEYSIKQIEKGVSVKDATYFPENIILEMGKSFKDIFKSPTKEEDKKPIDSEAIEKIKRKLSSPIVATNIRLIASSDSRIGAERILQEIESSFNQFTDTLSGGLKTKRLEKGRLQSMFKNFSFRSFDSSQSLPLNLKEITSIYHFQNSKLSPTPQLKQSMAISAPPPQDISSDGAYLGVNTFRNTDTKIYMKDIDRLRHTYTIGMTGTGKTTLLVNMIVQDIISGNGCCFIDPHGTDVQNILANVPKERFKDVIYFDPSYIERPMALNMLEYDRSHPEQKTFVVNELFSIFQKLYGAVPESMGPMFEQYFRNATMLVIEDPETGSSLLDVSRVMTNKDFRDKKIANCKNPVVVQFWREIAEKAGGEASLANIVPYITSKFDVFLANEIMRPIIAQEKSSFDFRKIMDEKKILLVNLSKGRLGDINTSLIGLILVGKILMAALSRVDMVGKDDFPPFYLYMDEFQNFTTNSISAILSEARKYKLSLNVAHQNIKQLDEGIKNSVFGNVGSIFSFRVGSEDAEFLEKQFSPTFTAKDIMNIDNFNFYAKMLVNGKTAKAFNVRSAPPTKGNDSVRESLKQLSYLTYGGDRDEIEREIMEKYQSK